MPDHPTYRVYTPNDLQTFSPSTLRTAPPPPERLWLGFVFVILFGLIISGASFAALRYLNVDLTSSRTSLAGMPAAPATTPDVAPSPSPVAPAPAVVVAPQAETSAAHPTEARRRHRTIRRHGPKAAKLPTSLPPNPF